MSSELSPQSAVFRVDCFAKRRWRPAARISATSSSRSLAGILAIAPNTPRDAVPTGMLCWRVVDDRGLLIIIRLEWRIRLLESRELPRQNSRGSSHGVADEEGTRETYSKALDVC